MTQVLTIFCLQDPNVAVHVQGLVKTYPGSHKCVGCRLKATKPYHAVKVWLSSLLKRMCFF